MSPADVDAGWFQADPFPTQPPPNTARSTALASSGYVPTFSRRTLSFAAPAPGGWPVESPEPGNASSSSSRPPASGTAASLRTGPPPPPAERLERPRPPSHRPPSGRPASGARGPFTTLTSESDYRVRPPSIPDTFETFDDERPSDRSTARMLPRFGSRPDARSDAELAADIVSQARARAEARAALEASAIELPATELVSDPDLGRGFHEIRPMAPPPPSERSAPRFIRPRAPSAPSLFPSPTPAHVATSSSVISAAHEKSVESRPVESRFPGRASSGWQPDPRPASVPPASAGPRSPLSQRPSRPSLPVGPPSPRAFVAGGSTVSGAIRTPISSKPLAAAAAAAVDAMRSRSTLPAPPETADRTWETKDTVRPPSPFVGLGTLPGLGPRPSPDAKLVHDHDLTAATPPPWATEAPSDAPHALPHAAKKARSFRPASWAASWVASLPPSPVRRAIVPVVVTHLVLAAAVLALIAGGVGRSKAVAVREPRTAEDDRATLLEPAVAPVPAPPVQGCATTGDTRLLAARAQIGPGLDVAVLDSGFAVGLASNTSEAVGMRLAGATGTGLRIVETLRVKSPVPVGHVSVEPGREDDGEALDVRVDPGEARSIVASGSDAGGSAFRVQARGGIVTAVVEDAHGIERGVAPKLLWTLPGAAANPKVALKTASADLVRAVGRDDGGALVAIRRGSSMWLGVVDATLTPAGPLVALSRKGASLGAPALSTSGGGGVVAWAERSPGEKIWSIVVASFAADGDGDATTLGAVRVVGHGMSPTIAELPDGDLLLAHADGAAGAHRVVATRLGKTLQPRGEAIVVSPDTVNAGQPSIAVRADGRALVAFFGADRGRLPSVHAASLACDPGL